MSILSALRPACGSSPLGKSDAPGWEEGSSSSSSSEVFRHWIELKASMGFEAYDGCRWVYSILVRGVFVAREVR